MLNLIFEYKANPTPEQVQMIEHTLTVCRKVWNFALRERKDWINSRKCQINACSLESEYIIPALECDVSVPDVMPHGHPVGIDLGLDKFVATSDGLVVDRPRFLNSLHRKLKLLQRRLKHKKKGSSNRHRLNRKIARLHQRISDTRKDWHFKLAHRLCDGAGMIFVEDIDFRVWAKGMFGKHTLDAGFGQFVNILKWVCWKRGVYFAEVNKDYTSQVCPQCDAHTGKKELKDRVHSCPECGYTTHRDVAAAQIVRHRGISEVGRILENKENACGDGLTGTGNRLVKNPRSKKKGYEARLQSAS
ncbi:MAG TPA: hypothetical protein DCL61_14695 [Cyanobacteria bacterium UBA12227]|nr:hypothetical protein [Cyanobacteria bacterium UBA12227]